MNKSDSSVVTFALWPRLLSFKSDLQTSFEYGRNGLLKTTCLVAEGELSIGMTDYLIFVSVNIVKRHDE